MMDNPFDIAKGMKNLNAFLWEEETNKQLMFRTMSNLVDSYNYDYCWIEEPETLILDALDELNLTRDYFSDETWMEIIEKAKSYCNHFDN